LTLAFFLEVFNPKGQTGGVKLGTATIYFVLRGLPFGKAVSFLDKETKDSDHLRKLRGGVNWGRVQICSLVSGLQSLVSSP
jgi:hypothetical protein